MNKALAVTDRICAVARLVVTDFRSYARAEILTDPRPVVLVGPNGAGKTNLLEAISMLTPGRGLRQARLHDITRREGTDAPSSAWAVAAHVGAAGDETLIGTGLALSSEGAPLDKRVVRLNGAAASSTQRLAEIVRLLWLTPAMDRLFLEGASGRRRFLDRIVLIFDPAHGTRANAYERAMRERLRLLKTGRREAAWLQGLELQVAEHGVALAAARREAVARLNVALAEGTGAFPAGGLSLEGQVETWLQTGSAIEAEDRLRDALADARERDAEAGRTTQGAHVSDLIVIHPAKRRAAAECSTGEQKALLIGIVLAAARIQHRVAGQAPILLLDEIAAHLDGQRRQALFDEIVHLGAQAWMTGTDASLFQGLGSRAQAFVVAAGRFNPFSLQEA